jgi:ADP-ribose pyrophosphatase YjhB (NUDIX family)
MPGRAGEFIRIRAAGLAIREGRILLAEHEKRGKRYFLLPGGGMEFGESIEETLRREFLEEAGVEARVGDLLWIVESIPKDRHRQILNLIVEIEEVTGNLAPVPDAVLRDVRWFDLEELPSIVLFPDTREEILRYVREGTPGPRLLGRRWKD